MDRQLYKQYFEKTRIPDWQCPTCEKSILQLSEDSFTHKETFESKQEHHHDAWDIEWVRYTFSCHLVCSNCKEFIVCTGTGKVDHYFGYNDRNEEEETDIHSFFPEYFNPPLKLIKIPKDTPLEIENSLIESFKVYFCSPNSAANHIRNSIEGILTDIKVTRYSISQGSKKPINLHQRISKVPPKYEKLKAFFLATKWLGNAGSHNGKSLSHDDVLDSYEFIEKILDEIYGKKNHLESKAKKINKAKGPVSSKNKKRKRKKKL